MDNIIWRASQKFSSYEVTQSGQVRSAKTQKVITQVMHKGLNSVRITVDGTRIFVSVAYLVADAFPAPAASAKSDIDTLDGIHRIANKNIQLAYNSRVGEMENGVEDGTVTQAEFESWIADQAFQDVYQAALHLTFEVGCVFPTPLKEMRFAGTEYCTQKILACFAADNYKVLTVTNTASETVRKPKGPKGVSVMCKETGVIYPSKSAAARANHMDGESVTDSIKYGRPRKGCTFILVGDKGDNN